MRKTHLAILATIAGGLIAVSVPATPQVPPAPICDQCSMNTNTGWTTNAYGTVSTTAACAVNGAGSGCDLSGTVTFTPGTSANAGGFYGTPCNGGACATVPTTGGTFGVGLNHATQTWSSVQCTGSAPSNQVVAFIRILAPGGSNALYGLRQWTCTLP